MDAPYFPFYPADWLADTNVQVMTLEERGAYIHLLAHMWREDGCSLPDDDKFLAKLLHVSSRKWVNLRKSLVDGLQAVFEKKSDGRLHNSRLDKEYGNFMKKSQSRSNAAKSRWAKDEDEDANAMQMHSKSSASAPVLHMQNDAISESESEPELEPDKRSERDIACAQIVRAFEETFGVIQGEPSQLMALLDYVDQGMEPGLVVMAIHKSSTADSPVKYANAILANQLRKGIKTVSSALEEGQSGEVRVEVSASRSSRRQTDKKQTAANDPRYANFYNTVGSG